ncbi:MAG: cyclic nucleotide-binding domain-containing protein [Deltaproteobacteria bacterium]|nr:cyclic nucleotide-binding domain-containing protein [Deltaproteobacteria bacterium]
MAQSRLLSGLGLGGGEQVTRAQIVQTILDHLAEGELDPAVRWYESCADAIGDAILGEMERGTIEGRKAIANLLYRARDYRRAALACEQMQEWIAAARAHEGAMAWDRAASCYLASGEKDRAAAMWSKAGEHRRASELFLELGDWSSACDALAEAADFFGAAKIAHNMGDKNRAMNLLAQVPPRDPGFALAASLLADVLVELDRRDLAIQRLYAVLPRDRQVRDRGSAELAYKLASLLADAGRPADARSTFAMVQSFDAGFKDVGARIAALAAAIPAPSIPPTARAPLETTPPAAAKMLAGKAVPPDSLTSDLELPKADLVARMERFELLKKLPIFEDLTLEEMKDFHALSEPMEFAAGDVLIEEGEPGRAIFFIREGRLEIVGVDGEEETLIAELGPGTYVGEMALIDEGPTSARVRAKTSVEALRIGKAAFLRYLYTHDLVAMRVYRSFTRTLVERLREANLRMKSKR